MKTIKFFIESIKMNLSQQMMYKINFFIRMFTLLTFDLILPLITIMIYVRTNGFPGWSFNEILLFQGTFIMINSVDRMFFQRVDWVLTSEVRTGNFDRYLLFPINTLAYISFTNFGLEHIMNFLIGVIVTIYSVFKIQPQLSVINIVLYLAYMFLALIFLFSLSILRYGIIVRTVQIGRLGELFRTIKSYGEYPVDIYNALISSVFRYLVPLAILAYYPSVVILQRVKTNFWLVFLNVGIIFILCLWFWRNTLKFYESAGG